MTFHIMYLIEENAYPFDFEQSFQFIEKTPVYRSLIVSILDLNQLVTRFLYRLSGLFFSYLIYVETNLDKECQINSYKNTTDVNFRLQRKRRRSCQLSQGALSEPLCTLVQDTVSYGNEPRDLSQIH